MGAQDNDKMKLTQLDSIIAGAGSGCITRMICQPLDVLKIRFQLQVEPISKTGVSKYQSIFQSTSLIIKEEGAKALWKGHIPAQFLSISYGMAQFWAFEALSKQAYSSNIFPSLSPIVNFTCGAIAGHIMKRYGTVLNRFVTGCSATVFSFPFDVVRTRLIAQSENLKVYSGVIKAFQKIVAQEGFFTLYRGMLPTFIQIAPHAGVQFMCYKFFNNLYKHLTNTHQTTLVSSFVAGSFAGLCAKTVVYPFDLAKKRMQIQGFQEARVYFGEFFKCRGLNDCLIRIYQVEGFFGLFKGLSPSMLKAVCTTALHFSSYEMICKFLEKED